MTSKKVFVGVLAVAVAAAGCHGGEARETEAARQTTVMLSTADVATAEVQPVGLGAAVTGTLRPYREVEVRAQVPGLVTGLRVDRGDAVRSGATLAIIEAEGILSQAAGAQAAVAAAESNLAVARRQADSAMRLFEAGALSELEYHGAQAGLAAAEAQLAATRAQAAAASEAARRATITAPINGEVSDRQVSEGEAVNPGQPLFTIVNTSVLELAGMIPVSQAAHVRPGQPVEFTLDAYPGRAFRGSVARVAPTAQPSTRQIGVYVQLPNPNRELVGGLFATGRILIGEADTVVVVPTSAVRGSGESAHVWLVDGGRAERRSVRVGTRDDVRGIVEILAGLQGGERVIAAPGSITEGMPVSLANTPGSGGGALIDE